MVARYGDYVLLKPPFKPGTLVLWLGAPVLLLVAGGMLLLAARRRRVAHATPPRSATRSRDDWVASFETRRFAPLLRMRQIAKDLTLRRARRARLEGWGPTADADA